MTRRPLIRLMVAATLAAGLLADVEQASAHPANSVTFPSRYKFRTVNNMYFASGTNTWWDTVPLIRQRVVDGMIKWNEAPPNSIHLADMGYKAGMSQSSFCNGNGNNVSGLFWTVVDGAGDFAALTTLCLYANDVTRISYATILFDGNEPNWHTDSGTAPPGSIDLRGVATHELGHVMGFFAPSTSHWDDTYPLLCDSVGEYHSMCGTVETGSRGTDMYQPGPHDYDTLNARYP